jgi:hypothetical protein
LRTEAITHLSGARTDTFINGLRELSLDSGLQLSTRVDKG